MKKTLKPVKKPAAKKPAARKPAPKKPAAKAAPAKAQSKADSSRLTSAEISALAAVLNETRQELSKNVEDKRNLDMVDNEGGDSIDQATRSLDKEILFELSDNERKMLADIEAALRKIEKGTYGLCEHCKNVIEKKRIKALPSARYCITCQSGTEVRRRE